MSSTFVQVNSQSSFEKRPLRSLVFIDSGVEDYESLTAGVLPGQQVVILDRTKNGIEQISSEIQQYASTNGAIDSVHIISHGSSGSLQLGNTALGSHNIEQYKSQLEKWQNSLAPEADIIVYGCDVASGTGANFVDRFSQLTGADVAASTNTTGSGGDWNLEFARGQIDSPSALQADAMASYRGDLATLVVANNSDSGPGSLRAAIATAVAGDIITFAPGLANQTITLTSGQLDIPVGKNITIDGAAAPGLTISGNNASRVIRTGSSTNVTLKNLIIANGKVSGTDPNNDATSAGGGIQTGSSSTLTLENSQVNNNVAGFGGGIYTGFRSTTTVINSKFSGNDGSLADNTERGGGAIATKSGGVLTIRDSEFTNNKGSYGGAVNNLLGSMTIENSKFTGNRTEKGVGGAVYVDGANASGPDATPGPVAGTIAIRNSVFDGNIGAREGGAGFLFGYFQDKIVLENSTFINNKAVKDLAGVGGSGGAIRHGNVDLTVTNSTFANNQAEDNGGGLWSGGNGNISIVNSTFSGNSAAKQGGGMLIANRDSFSTNIVNSTFAKNTAEFSGGIATFNDPVKSPITVKNSIFDRNTASNSFKTRQHTGRELIDGGNNLQFPAKLTTGDPNDSNVTANVRIADPLLGPLQNINGAFVLPLLVGSPAIDTGTGAGAPAADQRGVSRPQDGDNNGSAIVDIGAYEFNATVTPTLTGSLGQTNNYSSVSDLIAQWPNAAQNQGIKLSGIAFDGFETDYLNPNVISNLTLATNENPKSWLSYGSTGGIGVPSSYDGWFTDASKIRAEINHNPNTNQSQTLKVKWADNQDITSTTIDLSALSPKTSPGLGDQGNEVGFLQIFNNGVRVPATNFTIARLNAPIAPKPISVSSDGVTFIGDRTDGSFKFQIVGDSLSGATFDELRFSTKAYDSPTAAYAATSFKSDGSDYLVQKIEYQGISNVTPTSLSTPFDSLTGSIDTNAVPPTFFSYGSSPAPIADGGSGVVTINRTGDTSVPASIDFLIVAPSGGQPVNNIDYKISPFPVNPSSGTVNFNAGQTSVSLTINNLPGLTGGVVNLGFSSGVNVGTPASTAITLL